MSTLNETICRNYWNAKLDEHFYTSKFPYNQNFFDKGDKGHLCINTRLPKDVVLLINKLTNENSYNKYVFFSSIVQLLQKNYSDEEIVSVGIIPFFDKNQNLLRCDIDIKGSDFLKDIIEKMKKEMVQSEEMNSNFFEEIIENKNINKSEILSTICIYNIKSEIIVKKFLSDINFVFNEHGSNIDLKLFYSTNKYTSSYIKELIDNFICTVKRCLSDLRKNALNINVLSETQQKKVERFSTSHYDFNNQNELLLDSFEEQVKINPNNIAVMDSLNSLTYKKLDTKSSQLAHYIVEKHSNASNIGVLMDSTVNFVISVLAIMKAGKAFVPININYPKVRVKKIIFDADINIVITESFQECNVKNLNIEEINLDEYNNDYKNENFKNQDIAYLIYTSGTTGSPKGVAVSYKALSKTIVWRKEFYNLTKKNSTLLTVINSFDAFFGGLFSSLTSGSSVHLVKECEMKDTQFLNKLITKQQITHLYGTPSLIEEIVKYFKKNIVKTITIGGDYPTKTIIRECKNRGIELYNEYGPTECTILSTIYKFSRNSSILIGKPICDTEILILNNNQNICPVNVPGELYISGERLAYGYWKDQTLTSQNFLSLNSKKFFKTGDLAKWTSDGNIKLLGRKDSQHKINGYRVEIDEIENILNEHYLINSVKVIIKEYSANKKQIIAFYTSDFFVDNNKLVSYLEKYLPKYMMPGKFIRLKEIPLTNAGKIDEKQLLNINLSIKNQRKKAPYTVIQKEILAIWMKYLDNYNISITDDFFEIGGDSLKAIQVANAISEKYDISINYMYKYRTIEKISAQINPTHPGIKERLSNKLEDLFQGFENLEADKFLIEKNLNEEYREYKNSVQNIKTPLINKNFEHILLLGGNGFLGIYLLNNLLNLNVPSITLIIRGKNNQHALNRVKKSYKFYFNREIPENLLAKLTVISGDISKEKLGLSKKDYMYYSQSIDCIINSAAFVKHFGEYKNFYNINVIGTKNIVRFALNGLSKKLIHISTTSVGEGVIEGVNSLLFTEDKMDLNQSIDDYYIATKLESEKVIVKEKDRLDYQILRIGNLMFDSNSGKFQENIEDNAFYRNIRAYINLNFIPKSSERNLNFTFVNEAAEAIMLLFQKRYLNKKVFHLYNPNEISFDKFLQYLRIYYPDIQSIQYKELLEFIIKNIDKSEKRHYIDDLLAYLDLDRKTFTKTVSDKTCHILSECGFKWSMIDNKKIENMVEYCKKIEFLP